MFRVTEVERVQLRHVLDVSQARVADRGVVEDQPLHVRHRP